MIVGFSSKGRGLENRALSTKIAMSTASGGGTSGSDPPEQLSGEVINVM